MKQMQQNESIRSYYVKSVNFYSSLFFQDFQNIIWLTLKNVKKMVDLIHCTGATFRGDSKGA